MRKIILIITALSLSGCFWDSKNEKQPFATGTLGEKLLPSFNKVNQSCGLSFSASIDSEISGSRKDDLNLQVDPITGSDLSAMFKFIYSTEDISEFRTNKAKTQNYLISTNTDPIKVKDQKNLYYAYTCTKALKNVANANASASFTAASINTAVDVETNSTKRRDLVLSQGTFDSPVTYNLNSDQKKITKQYFDFLRLYERNPALNNATHWYLDRIYGWFVSWTTSQNGSKSANIKLEANANYMTAGISDKLTYGLSDSVKLELNDFDFFTIPYSESIPLNKSYNFLMLPSVSDISQYLASSSTYKSYNDPDYIYAVKGGMQKHIQAIPGLFPISWGSLYM